VEVFIPNKFEVIEINDKMVESIFIIKSIKRERRISLKFISKGFIVHIEILKMYLKIRIY
jgi:hypothetical protein